MNTREPLKPAWEGMAGLPTRTPVDRIGHLSEGTAADRSPFLLYGAYYGLKESPFELTPNPRFLFLSTYQREALSNLRYGLATRKGFTLLVGDAGMGKTTLVRAALAELGHSPGLYVLLSNPTLKRNEFYEYLAEQFGLSAEAAVSKARFLAELQTEVEARYAEGGFTGLIVDEAQSMSYELLEEIRLLGNIETTTTKLLNIVLCGQPELAARLNESSLRQLKQRIVLRCELHAFTLEETAGYISGRIRIAGGSPADVFTIPAVMAIHNASAGIPRLVNVLCDNALISGFAAQLKPIPVRLVEDACRDFDLSSGSSATEVEPNTAPVASESVERNLGSRSLAEAAETPTGPNDGPQMFRSIQPKAKRRFSFFS